MTVKNKEFKLMVNQLTLSKQGITLKQESSTKSRWRQNFFSQIRIIFWGNGPKGEQEEQQQEQLK